MADKLQRIHILGGPGSGKSYLARRLAAALGAPVCHLDDLFWDNDADTYGVRADPGKRGEALREFVARDGWVVEGVYHQDWVHESFQRADAIVVLTPSVWVRDGRIAKRFIGRKVGWVPAPKRETFLGQLSLLRWNHGYNRDNLARTMEVLDGFAPKVHTFRSADDAAASILNRTPEAEKGNAP
ncbi:MAG: DNA topology modulation protein FlaR [bacterium]|nr:DNA topology modulation protein FlaR [bacterium]